MASALTYVPCGCGCRPADATEPGCSCPECQPGPGIIRNPSVTRRQTRMRELLERYDLTEDEEKELDDLLHLYIHNH